MRIRTMALASLAGMATIMSLTGAASAAIPQQHDGDIIVVCANGKSTTAVPAQRIRPGQTVQQPALAPARAKTLECRHAVPMETKLDPAEAPRLYSPVR